MRYDAPLLPATLVKRYKRFLADVTRPDGELITLHCPNTGSMKNCLFPEHRVWYSLSDNAKRKYPGTWEQAEVPVNVNGEPQLHRVGLNTARANTLVEELVYAELEPLLSGYTTVRREVKYGEENSRIDLLLQAEGLPDCYIEVKSVTLAMGDGLGQFPDAVTSRGTKHLRELMHMVEQGHRAVLFFCVQHSGIERFSVAAQIDPTYATTLKEAISAGVEVIVWGAQMSDEAITLNRRLTFES